MGDVASLRPRPCGGAPGGRFSAVLFDLDGTLVDSVPDIAGALNTCLMEAGFEPLPVAAVRDMIDAGLEALLEAAFARRGATPTAAEAQAWAQRFLRLYGGRAVRETVLKPGAAALVEALASAGIRTGVCTNKPEGLAHAVLDGLGLKDRLRAVVCAGGPHPKKPDPTILRVALARLGARAGEAVLIGDNEADVAAGRAAGTAVFLVEGGHTLLPASRLGADDAFTGLDDARLLRRLIGA